MKSAKLSNYINKLSDYIAEQLIIDDLSFWFGEFDKELYNKIKKENKNKINDDKINYFIMEYLHKKYPEEY